MSPQQFQRPQLITAAITNPPTEFPKFTVGGDPFEERFTLMSSYHLETRCNIPAHKLSTWIDQQVQLEHLSSMFLIMTASMLGHSEGLKWTPTPMLPEELAARVTPEEWTIIMGHYTDAMSKVAAAVGEIRKKLETPPPQEETPVPVN